MKYLIDTDWVIDHLNGVEKITKKLEELASEGIVLNIVSLAELYEGIYSSTDFVRNEKTLKRFLEGIPVLEVNEEICKIFGKERAKLRKRKELIGDFDLLIASICLHYRLTLLTNNLHSLCQCSGKK